MKKKLVKYGYFALFLFGLVLVMLPGLGLSEKRSVMYIVGLALAVAAVPCRNDGRSAMLILAATGVVLLTSLLADLSVLLQVMSVAGVVCAVIGALMIFSIASRNGRTRFDTKRTALCGVLLSLMLILGWVEHLLPINAGIPGIKLGLSNSVLIFAVYMLDVPTTYVLMLLKVLLSAAFMGTPASMIMYGLAGGLLSVTGMLLLSRIPAMHKVTVSMMGGVLHNVGQVAVYMCVMPNVKLLYYMAVLMLVGLACGALTGVVAERTLKHLKHMKF